MMKHSKLLIELATQKSEIENNSVWNIENSPKNDSPEILTDAQYLQFSTSSVTPYCTAEQSESPIKLKLRRLTKQTSEVIEELCGATYPIEAQYIVRGENDYSLIKSGRTKLNLLFLGPAAFCNHNSGVNAEIISTSKTRSDVKAIKDIQAGEKITVYYGRHYFNDDNLRCQSEVSDNDCIEDLDMLNGDKLLQQCSTTESNALSPGRDNLSLDHHDHFITPPNGHDGSNDASEKTTEQITVVDKSP
ncbi:hypothetical protein AGLY_014073 [Aphis glycines]|uniref:SET domain-containing protein n=1 Tax=Aphis glycines TaxID=307491 RepID=A0A6G0T4W9_APHGL|nr:hypothetical protein AGLY_014073 [Aphis glycines]